MQFFGAMWLVIAVHLATQVSAWARVGLLADDHHMVGGAILRHRGDWTFGSIFWPDVLPDATSALYRPFIDLAFWLEEPWFGNHALGYHVVNSVLHCGTAMLWFVLVRRWSGSVAAALATAVLFVGWPGHSEATHWIAVRVNLQATFFMSWALLLLDGGLVRSKGPARSALLWSAAGFGVLAIGSKESGVFVLPLAALLAWLRTSGDMGWRRRAWCTGWAVAPITLAAVLWLWWRAIRLGTWGSGTTYGWHWHRVTWTSIWNWVQVLMAPVHATFTPGYWVIGLWVLQGGLLLVALLVCCCRPGARTALALGGLLLLLGFLAGIGLERLDLATLENVRYTYEPALGLAALLGLGIAALPFRARGAALAVMVLAYTIVLDGNRQSWLRAGDVYRRMEHDVGEQALRSQAPLRVLDAPGVYEGAFACLNGFTEFRFLQAFGPPGANLRGALSSTQEWRPVLHELAAAAVQGKPLPNAFAVQWDDGALVPFELDRQWPQRPWPGTTVAYARVARVRPFLGTTLPVHVLVQTAVGIELQVRAQVGGRAWSASVVSVAGQVDAQTLRLPLDLPADLEAGQAVAIELVVRHPIGEHAYGLGVTTPVTR